MIRRAAWRAVGLTELPAAQRKRAVCRVARRPFEAARRPRPGKWSPPAASPAHRSAAARRGAAPSRRAPAPRSAPPRPLHTWRAPGSARPHPRTAPAGSGGRREIFPGGRRRRVRGAVGAHRGAPGGADRGARARGRAGTRYRAHRKNAIYPLSVLLGGWGMPRFPFTRGVINPNRGPGSVTRVITR